MVYHAEFAWLPLVERCYYWLLPLDLEVINVVETADFMLVIVKVTVIILFYIPGFVSYHFQDVRAATLVENQKNTAVFNTRRCDVPVT